MKKAIFETKALTILTANALILISVLSLFSCRETKAKLTIACAGDSLMRPIPLYLRNLLPATRVRIRDWSQGGLSSVNYLSFFRRHPRWQRERVDFVLLQIGTNDVPLLLRREENEREFWGNLEAIIAEFKKRQSNYFRQPQIVIATVPFFYGLVDEGERNRVVSELVNPIIIALARKERINVVDQAGCLKGCREYYEADGIHPNREGEKALARNWRRVVKNIWLMNRTK